MMVAGLIGSWLLGWLTRLTFNLFKNLLGASNIE